MLFIDLVVCTTESRHLRHNNVNSADSLSPRPTFDSDPGSLCSLATYRLPLLHCNSAFSYRLSIFVFTLASYHYQSFCYPGQPAWYHYVPFGPSHTPHSPTLVHWSLRHLFSSFPLAHRLFVFSCSLFP